MGTLNIPGLIAKKTAEEAKLTEAELQGKRDKFAEQIASWKPNDSMTMSYDLTLDQVQKMYPNQKVSVIDSNGNCSYVDYNSGVDPNYLNYPNTGIPAAQQLAPYIGDVPGLGNGWKQPATNPFDEYQKNWKNPGPFGGVKGSPKRQTDDSLFEEMLRSYARPVKSSFEDLLDTMFDAAEREQFLISVGFEFTHEDGKDYISRTVGGLLEKGEKNLIMGKIFLREITLKFKNLLLTKVTLKIKL